MTLLALLHDVHDAEYVLRHFETYSAALLLSTHESVNDYLFARGRKCVSLSSFLSMDELSGYYRQSECVYSLLDALDGQFGSLLHEVIQSPRELRYFYTLYRYLGRYEYTNILKVQLAFEKLQKEYALDTVHLFLSHISESTVSFFSTELNIYKIALESAGMVIKEVTAPLSAPVQRREKFDHWKYRLNRARWFFMHKLIGVLKRTPKWNQGKNRGPGAPTLVAIKPAGFSGEPKELFLLLDGTSTTQAYSGLQERLDETVNLLDVYPADGKDAAVLPASLKDELNDSHQSLASRKRFDPLFFLRTVLLNDFINKFDHYVQPLRRAIAVPAKHHIVGGAWYSPPIQPSPKALLTEYLLQAGLPVLGAQHGGNYGIQSIYSRHFDSDFWWCSHYFSWGFTKADLKETYPYAEPRCEILPLGRKRSAVVERSGEFAGFFGKKRVDILFPISNASYFHRDSLRIPQHLLGQYQRELLLFLDELKDYSIVVKPFQAFGYKNSAFMEILRGLSHVRVESHLSFSECFETYRVRSVLIEYPSSPLFEAMREQTEILALTNEIIQYNPTAGELLQRRVHLFDNVPDLEKGLRDFLEGRLAKRRDNGFVEKYLTSFNHQHCAEIAREIFRTS